jgi:hypothetical protein
LESNFEGGGQKSFHSSTRLSEIIIKLLHKGSV